MTIGSTARTTGSQLGLLAGMRNQLDTLELALRKRVESAVAVDTYTWHFEGAFAVGAAPHETGWATGVGTTLMAHTVAAGLTDTLFDFYIDGTAIVGVTVPAGQTDPVIVPLIVPGNIVYAGGKFWPDVTVRGSDALDLVVKFRVKSLV